MEQTNLVEVLFGVKGLCDVMLRFPHLLSRKFFNHSWLTEGRSLAITYYSEEKKKWVKEKVNVKAEINFKSQKTKIGKKTWFFQKKKHIGWSDFKKQL